jgi:hypothetical protein
MDTLKRWPLLLASLALVGAAIGIDLGTEGARSVSVALVVLGASCLGAFIYAEGARHREWWGRGSDPDDRVD